MTGLSLLVLSVAVAACHAAPDPDSRIVFPGELTELGEEEESFAPRAGRFSLEEEEEKRFVFGETRKGNGNRKKNRRKNREEEEEEDGVSTTARPVKPNQMEKQMIRQTDQ